jgi:hypothetical protein
MIYLKSKILAVPIAAHPFIGPKAVWFAPIWNVDGPGASLIFSYQIDNGCIFLS